MGIAKRISEDQEEKLKMKNFRPDVFYSKIERFVV